MEAAHSEVGAEILQQGFSRESAKKRAVWSHDHHNPSWRHQLQALAVRTYSSSRVPVKETGFLTDRQPIQGYHLRRIDSCKRLQSPHVRCHSDGPLGGPDSPLCAVWTDGSPVVFATRHDGGGTLCRARKIIDTAPTMFSLPTVSWANGCAQIAIDPRHGTKSARLVRDLMRYIGANIVLVENALIIFGS